MKLVESYDKRIWRCDIISKSHDTIEIKSQNDDSGSGFCTDVHKELLCFYSPYYTAAMKGKFSENCQESFTLELNHRQTRLFVEWLYTGRIEIDFCWIGKERDDINALYVFADQTDIIALRRSIMISLVSIALSPVTPKIMARLVSQLPNSSGLRLYLLEQAVAEWRIDASEKVVTVEDWEKLGYAPEDYPEDFWDQLVNGQHDRYLPSCNACDYHEHTDEQEWKMTCATQFVPRRVMAPRARCYKNASS